MASCEHLGHGTSKSICLLTGCRWRTQYLAVQGVSLVVNGVLSCCETPETVNSQQSRIYQADADNFK